MYYMIGTLANTQLLTFITATPAIGAPQEQTPDGKEASGAMPTDKEVPGGHGLPVVLYGRQAVTKE